MVSTVGLAPPSTCRYSTAPLHHPSGHGESKISHKSETGVEVHCMHLCMPVTTVQSKLYFDLSILDFQSDVKNF